MPKIKATMCGPKDNVGLALQDLDAGTVLDLKVGECSLTIKLVEPISYQHKFSVERIGLGEDVVKYGEVIGKATKQIDPGQHVHIHNMSGLRIGATQQKEAQWTIS